MVLVVKVLRRKALVTIRLEQHKRKGMSSNVTLDATKSAITKVRIGRGTVTLRMAVRW